MRPGRAGLDHVWMTDSAPGAPRLYRRADRRVLGGVASGIADHLRIPANRVRLAFILLTFADGVGVILYVAYWIVVPAPPGTARRSRFRGWLAYAVGGVLVRG